MKKYIILFFITFSVLVVPQELALASAKEITVWGNYPGVVALITAVMVLLVIFLAAVVFRLRKFLGKNLNGKEYDKKKLAEIILNRSKEEIEQLILKRRIPGKH